MFGTGSGVLMNPPEERLKAESANVKRCTYIPMQAVVRIDEVEKEGANKIIAVTDKGDNVAVFPSPVFTTKRDIT